MAQPIVVVASVVQGAADAFAIATINTGLAGNTEQGYRLKLVQYEVPNLPNAVTSNWEFALSRVTKAAVPNVSDNDVLFKDKRQGTFLTSGAVIQDLVQEFEPISDIIVIETQLFLVFDSNATLQVNSLFVRLEFEPVKVSLADKVAILQNSIG